MKKVFARALLALPVVLLLLIAGSFLIWAVKPSRPLDVFILNKTVPTQQRHEHRSLHWVLNHHKYVKKDNSRYQLKKDYYGFFPINPEEEKFDFRSLSLRDVERISDSVDMAFYADTYGVYYNDWYTGKGPDVSDTQKVYGGLNQNDYLLLKALKEKGKTIVTEFVLLDQSASNLVRRKTEELLHLQWEGWIGKYFSSLRPNAIPGWIRDLYNSRNKESWPYSGPGVVLIHKYGKVVVLEEGQHLDQAMPQIITQPQLAGRFTLPTRMPYPNWFDITLTDSTNQVAARFQLNTTSQGDSLLNNFRLKPTFPAIIQHKESYRFYYFAGDFSQNPVSTPASYFEGIHHLDFLLYDDEPASSGRFFWKYYLPLTRGILREVYQDNQGVNP